MVRTQLVLALGGLWFCGNPRPSTPPEADEADAVASAPESEPEMTPEEAWMPPISMFPPEPDDLARVAALANEEMTPLLDHPKLIPLLKRCLETGEIDNPKQAGVIVADALVRRGLPLLDDAQLRAWNEARTVFSLHTRGECAMVWNNSLTYADQFDALSFSDPKFVATFFRTRANAAVAALGERGPAPPAQSFEAALQPLRAKLSAAAWAKVEATLPAPTTVDDACFLQLNIMRSARRLPDAEHAAIVRAYVVKEAQQEPDLPAACLPPR